MVPLDAQTRHRPVAHDESVSPKPRVVSMAVRAPVNASTALLDCVVACGHAARPSSCRVDPDLAGGVPRPPHKALGRRPW